MKKRNYRKMIVFAGVAAMCSIVAAVVMTCTPEAETQTREAAASGMPVTIASVTTGNYPATVSVLGEVVPQWESTLKSQVNGKIDFISERLRVGNRVQRDELLVRVAKEQLEMALAEARNRLSEASVLLLKEEREFNEARKNWKQSGIAGDPQSPLVLRKPQLTAARSSMKAARAALAHAEAMLAQADIRAPFDGVIVKRMVNPGEMLFPGDAVATLYDMKTALISVHLDAAQWNLLGPPAAGVMAKLHDPLQGASWPAMMVRESRRLDAETRLRTLFLQVDRPLDQTPPLLPGTFVRAVMTGRTMGGLLRIPGTALTQQGVVWFVDAENRLFRHRTDPVFHGRGVVYIREPVGIAPPLNVAVSPNSSFMHGLTVQPTAGERK